MPDYVGMGSLPGYVKNTAKGSTNHGESTVDGKSDKVTTKGMFRRGPISGIIDQVTMQQEGINPSSENPLGGVVIVFTLESIDWEDSNETGTPPSNDIDGDGFKESMESDEKG